MGKEEIKFMLIDIEERCSQLSEWEENFIGSIEDQYRERGILTEKQENKLNDIYERVTENG